MEETNYVYRCLSRFVLEAKTALAIGSGDKNVLTDALVLTDVNGLPYIPGTSIGGVLRHAYEAAYTSDKGNSLFGFQKKKEGQGSKIIFSDGRMIGKEGEVIDGLVEIDWKDPFYSKFKTLPIRQHCRINELGVACDKGKFDQQVVYKGTRFAFEVEMVASDEESVSDLVNVLKELGNKAFRLGGNTRAGLGEVTLVDFKYRVIDCRKSEQLSDYLNKSASLCLGDFWANCDLDNHFSGKSDWVEYQLTLSPEDFIFFGSGFGSERADMACVTESMIDWSSGKPHFLNENILIPGSSIKGAIAHRVAFHYNKISGNYADAPKLEKAQVNEVIDRLFGSEESLNTSKPKRGNVLISDIIVAPLISSSKKLLQHVKIDRFTGGAIQGALFGEEPIFARGQLFNMNVLVHKEALSEKSICDAFEKTLGDICCGLLPLGGGVNRGNGCFIGTIVKSE